MSIVLYKRLMYVELLQYNFKCSYIFLDKNNDSEDSLMYVHHLYIDTNKVMNNNKQMKYVYFQYISTMTPNIFLELINNSVFSTGCDGDIF